MGLSPRGRGNREMVQLRRPDVRSIPAWAGEPSNKAIYFGAERVYPRVGGGTMDDKFQAAWEMGLSPRGRGN